MKQASKTSETPKSKAKAASYPKTFTLTPAIAERIGLLMEREGVLVERGALKRCQAKGKPAFSGDPYDPDAFEASLGKGAELSASARKLFPWIKKKSQSGSQLFLAPAFAFLLSQSQGIPMEEMAPVYRILPAILGGYRPLFSYLPLEETLKGKEKQAQKAVKDALEKQDAAPFILFLLKEIDASLSQLSASLTGFEGQKSPLVRKLLDSMRAGQAYSASQLMEKLGLKSRVAIKRNYLEPALRDGYVKMLLPDKPHSPNQRYLKASLPPNPTKKVEGSE